MTDAFDKVTYHGKLMDKKTMAFLQAMEAKLGYELTILQGCYNGGVDRVAASGGTHDGGGVIDLAPGDWERKVKVGADLGAFIWHRTPIPGVWGEHVHFGIRNHGRLSYQAQRQQEDWDARPPRNGLAGHAPMTSDMYHNRGDVTFVYPVKEPIVLPQVTNVTRSRDKITEAIADINQAIVFIEKAGTKRPGAYSQLDELKASRRALKATLAALPKK